MKVISKLNGYHPASGLHLEEGTTYTINEADFAADVFTPVEPEPDKTAKEGK